MRIISEKNRFVQGVFGVFNTNLSGFRGARPTPAFPIFVARLRQCGHGLLNCVKGSLFVVF